MRIVQSLALPLAVAIQLLAPGSASAQQVGIHFRLGNLPARPHFHRVQPGVQIVEGYPDAQVYYTRGSYWCRRQDGWYSARSPRAYFYRVDDDDVPPGLQQDPGGPYPYDQPGDEERREEWRRALHDRDRAGDRHEAEERQEAEERHERHEAEERREAREQARRQHEHEEHEHGFD